MARKRAPQTEEREEAARAEGSMGCTRPARPGGTPGQNAPLDVIDRLSKELESAQRELRVQFTRIAHLQAELDQMRAAVKNASN